MAQDHITPSWNAMRRPTSPSAPIDIDSLAFFPPLIANFAHLIPPSHYLYHHPPHILDRKSFLLPSTNPPQTTRRTTMQTNTNTSRPSPSPGQAAEGNNPEGAMNSKGSDVLEIPLVHMLSHRPTLRIVRLGFLPACAAMADKVFIPAGLGP